MVHAYHGIFCAYGFWLPNDPRGSWSDFVAAWELFRFGKATGNQNIRRSVAHRVHDRDQRLCAKQALKYPPVVFTGIQARAAGRGLAIAAAESQYEILACAILPEHVHIVVLRHKHSIERIIGHLKSRATHQLISESLHPLAEYFQSKELPLTPWAENRWKVFLNNDHDIRRAIKYVENNPLKEGKSPQQWSFIKKV
jgi:REP element-mobilizing transposase RayT